jgi:cell wall-associated NlpC family hydrolase
LIAALALTTVCASACAGRGGTPRPFPTPSGPGAARRVPPAVGDLPRSGDAVALLATALTALGARYEAGGHAPETGFDCSGLVAWVFAQHGFVLPRTVGDQFAFGERVSATGPPSAGDLVFFRTGSGGDATHVGIALGDGRFLHAPSARGVVRIEPLSARYWSTRYVGARRILAPAGSEP